MDSCGKRKKKTNKSKEGDYLPDDLPIPEPNGFRHIVQNGYELNKFLLDYFRYFLPICGVVSWVIFLLFKS